MQEIVNTEGQNTAYVQLESMSEMTLILEPQLLWTVMKCNVCNGLTHTAFSVMGTILSLQAQCISVA